jgi:glutamyl-tRNA reductase
MGEADTGRHISVLGVDHHRTPIALRERLALIAGATGELVSALTALPGCSEVVVLSTCNRLECFCAGTCTREDVAACVARCQDLEATILAEHAFWHQDTDCIRHLFRVASGLESLVLGEYQIVHQVKSAYDAAHLAGTTGPFLNPLFQRSLAAAKEVRNRTAIGKHKLSVASVAVDLAKQVHGDLARARLLVVGAGEIAELAVKYLVAAGVGAITLVNRSEDRAQALADQVADFKPSVLPWSRLAEAIAGHDIVVSSTSAPHAVVTVADVRQAMRHRDEPLVMLDLALPRDIEPAVGDLDDVFLYNLDHLDAVVAANRQVRREDLDAADAIITEQVLSYLAEVRQDRAELMGRIANYFRDVVDAEETRLKGRLPLENSGEVRYALERVGNKLQHRILAWLRTHHDDPQAERLIRDLLGL